MSSSNGSKRVSFQPKGEDAAPAVARCSAARSARRWRKKSAKTGSAGSFAALDTSAPGAPPRSIASKRTRPAQNAAAGSLFLGPRPARKRLNFNRLRRRRRLGATRARGSLCGGNGRGRRQRIKRLHGKNLEPTAALCHAPSAKIRRACLVIYMSDNVRLSQGQPAPLHRRR